MRDGAASGKPAAVWRAHLRKAAGSGPGQAALTLTSTGIVLALNVGTGIIMARFLGPEQRGVMIMLGVWNAYLAALVTLGLPSAINHVINRQPQRAAETLATSAVLAVVVGALAGMAAALVLPHLLVHYTPSDVRFAQLTLANVPFVLLLGVSIAGLQARQRFGAVSVFRIAPPLVTVVALVALALTGHLDPRTGTIAYVLPVAVLAIVSFVVAMPARPRPSLAMAKRLLRYGLRAYGAEAVGAAGSHVDRALVAMVLAPPIVAIYFVGRSLADALSGVQASLSVVVLPKASGQSTRRAAELSALAARFGLAGAGAAALALGVLAPQLVPLAYGPGFEGSVPVFRLLAAEVVLTGAAHTLAQAYLAAGRPGFISTVQGLLLGATVLGLIFAVPRAGLHGAVAVLLCVSVMRLAVVVAGYRLVLKEGWPALFLRVQDVRAMVRNHFPAAAQGPKPGGVAT